ncbi:MAG: MFS transporter, partial [Clostridia bacterium]|nr:MFS transporter [Clostridia bacterium]
LFSNHYMDRFSSKTLTSLSIGLMMLQFVFYGFCRNLVIVLAAMLLLKAVCGTLFMMVQLKVIRGVVGESSVSTALGSVNSMNALATIVIQNAGGWLAGALGIQALYIGLSVLSAVAFTLCLFLKVNNTKKFFS